MQRQVESQMTIVNTIYAAWRDLIDNKSDQRVKDWPLMQSPLPTLCICLTYAFLAKVIGPKIMANRKPFQLRKIIIFYNAIQVAISVKLFYDCARLGWMTDYSWRCEPLDRTPTGKAWRVAFGCYLYYLSKFSELFDTLFFVLRKRFDQVSTLHVIHHGIMPFSVWWGVKFSPGGHGTFFGFINTGIHVVMYTYYMLAAFGPHMQKYLWWKRYLTVMQMIQFIAVMIHAIQLLFYNPCNYYILFTWVLIAHAVMFFVLFKAFYKEAYKAKKNDDLYSPGQKEQTFAEYIKDFKQPLSKVEESFYTLTNQEYLEKLYGENPFELNDKLIN